MHIAGLPVSTWLLMLAAVGTGLLIELAFLRARRRSPRDSPRRDEERAP